MLSWSRSYCQAQSDIHRTLDFLDDAIGDITVAMKHVVFPSLLPLTKPKENITKDTLTPV